MARGEPTLAQAELLEHLVSTGRPWAPGMRLASAAARLTTVEAAFRAGWLLEVELAVRKTRVVVGVITPAGRRALKAFEPTRDTGWSDEDRIRMREDDGGRRCLGPLEAEECAVHEGELEVYRWTWVRPPHGASHALEIAHGEPEAVKACPRCKAESDALAAAEARRSLGERAGAPW